jgi:hypothetical protein
MSLSFPKECKGRVLKMFQGVQVKVVQRVEIKSITVQIQSFDNMLDQEPIDFKNKINTVFFDFHHRPLTKVQDSFTMDLSMDLDPASHDMHLSK